MTSAETDKIKNGGGNGRPSDDMEPTPEELAAIEADDLDDGEEVSEVESLRAEAALNLDRYQRAVADLANYRRRKDQEVLRVGAQTKRSILRHFLPVVDDFERAIKAADADTAGAEWIEGFKLIERKLWSVLESEGVRPMQAVGEPFDPNFHEAVEVESGVENPNYVVAEHQRGFFIDDEVLRPAMVKVGAGDDGAK
ncbi:MAG: nucleotide exchange factor GrpE [Thermomicrobiales bacterium]